MGAESTRNMYSNLAENNKYGWLKLHHVGYLIKQTDDTRNHKYKIHWIFVYRLSWAISQGGAIPLLSLCLSPI
jgi:hypothetical protein